MARDIFRKEALNRLASPERTDFGLRLVGASGWIVLLAFLVSMGAAVGWALSTEAPIKVRGQGILIDRSGLVEISSEQGGRIQEMLLQPGQTVTQGDVVARLSRTALARELGAAKAELEDREERYRQVEKSSAERLRREGEADALRKQTFGKTLAALQERAIMLTDRLASLEDLAKRGLVPQMRVVEAQIAVTDLDERIRDVEQSLQQIVLDAAERESAREIQRIEERIAIEEIRRRTERLSDRFAEEGVIRATRPGMVVEIKVNAGDVLAPGDALATLAPNTGDRNLEALLFVPPADGKRIEAGMRAEIAPTTVEREVYGFALGEVASVSPLPATPEGMRRLLQNDQLVEQLSLGGAPIEVRVRLERDQATPTGFAWSASQGPVGGVNAGTLLDGRIVVAHHPLPDIVVPGISEKLRRWTASVSP